MKRCKRAGLPLYPPAEVLQAYHLQYMQMQYFVQAHPSSPFSFSSLQSSYHHGLNNISHSSAANPQQNHPDSSCYINPQYPQFKFPNVKSGNGNMVLPVSPVSSYRSSSSSLFNQSFAATDSHGYHFGSYNYGFDNTNNVAMAGSTYESLPLVQGSNAEVSNSQSPHGSITSASSYPSSVYGLVGASSIANGYNEVAPLSPPHGNSGLLEDLVVEAHNLCRKDKSKSEDPNTTAKLSSKRKSMIAEEYVEEKDTVLVESPAMKNSGNTANKKQRVDSNSSQISAGETINLFLFY